MPPYLLSMPTGPLEKSLEKPSENGYYSETRLDAGFGRKDLILLARTSSTEIADYGIGRVNE